MAIFGLYITGGHLRWSILTTIEGHSFEGVAKELMITICHDGIYHSDDKGFETRHVDAPWLPQGNFKYILGMLPAWEGQNQIIARLRSFGVPVGVT